MLINNRRPKTNHNKDFTEIKDAIKTTTCNVCNKEIKQLIKEFVKLAFLQHKAYVEN